MHEQPPIGQLVFNEREIMVRHFRHFGFQRCRSFGPIRINFRSTDLTEEDMNGRCDIHVKGLHVSRSEEHTSELQSLMRISYAVFCLKQKNNTTNKKDNSTQQ